MIVAAAGVTILGTAEQRLEFPARIEAAPSRVAVLDGATLRIDETAVGLAGVAASRPEAARTLAAMVRDRTVECQLRASATADAGRREGVCRAGGVDLGRAVVESGWAVVRPSAPVRLVSAEESARAGHRGVWAGR